ncbi:hypothetical protein [Pseudomonas helleri]|uniref:hypothetical protein n=1 Tax=Pseudomonas helleri TaxID=1608996 RepID=UPI003F9C0263
MNGAKLVFDSVVTRYGMAVRVVSFEGKSWVLACDVVTCLGLGKNNFTDRIATHPDIFQGEVEKVRVDNSPAPCWVLSETACRLFVCGLKSKDADLIEDFLAWLEAGGMQNNTAASAEAVPVAANVLAFKATNSAQPAGKSERQRAYCRDLLKTLLRYATDAEAEELTYAIESEVADLLNRRHCPGLNDARYELYRRFWLQGGDV